MWTWDGFTHSKAGDKSYCLVQKVVAFGKQGGSLGGPFVGYGTMIKENRQLVTNEPVSLRINRLKLKTTGKLPIILEESIEYTPI